MHWRNWVWLALLITIVLTGGCQSEEPRGAFGTTAMAELAREPLQAKPWQFGQSPGLMVTTEHYRIYTTIRDPIYQRLIGKTLETAHARFVSLNPRASVHGPMECYVFGDRPGWELYTKLRMGSAAPVYLQITAGGYCQEGVFAGYDIGREQTLSVIAHEAWHQYSWFAFKDRLPSWLEEGLATQNEGIDWQGTTPKFVPHLNYRRWLALRTAIRENRLWKLDELTRTHAGRVVKLSQKHVDAYYAQIWALALFLEHSPYEANLREMIRRAEDGELHHALVGAGVSPSDVVRSTERWNEVAGPLYLRRFIASDVPALEREYDKFIHDLADSWPPKLPR